MSNKSNRPGTEFSDDEIALITSLGLLGVTPAGQHIAKTGAGTLNNTTDSGGGGGSYTFENGLSEASGQVKLGGQLTGATVIDLNTGVSVAPLSIEDSTTSTVLFDTDGNSTNIRGTVSTLIESPITQIKGTSEIRLITPAITAATATVGQVPVLISTAGEVEFQTLSSGGGQSFTGTVTIPSSYEYIFSVTDTQILTTSILGIQVYNNVNDENEDEDVLVKIKNTSTVTPNTAEISIRAVGNVGARIAGEFNYRVTINN